jgi:DNA replication protein DnaC
MNKPKIWEILGVSRPTFYRWDETRRETEIKAKLSQENSLIENEVLRNFSENETVSKLSLKEAPKFKWELEDELLEEEVKRHLENLTQEQRETLEMFKDPKYGRIVFGNDPRLILRLANIPELEKITPIPRGRMIEIYGDKGVGKTTLGLRIAKEFQKNSPLKILFIDTDNSMSREYLDKSGLTDVELISEEDAKTALETYLLAASSHKYSLIILDSIANMKPKAEDKGEIGDANMGIRAFMMNQFVRKLTPLQNKETTFLFMNQIRDSLKSFGSPYDSPGGHAMKHGATLRLYLKRGKIQIEKTKFGDIPNGTEFKYEW